MQKAYEIERRWEALLGEAPGLYKRIAVALGKRGELAMFAYRRNGWPIAALNTLDLLEKVEPAEWPQPIIKGLRDLEQREKRRAS